MHTPSLLIAAGLVLSSTLLLRAATTDPVLPSATAAQSAELGRAPECGGEPCDAVLRGLRAFLDRKLAGLEGNGRACADCHMPTDSFQLSPASAEAQVPAAAVAAALQSERRRSAVPADRRRRLPDQRRRRAATSATCARTDWCAITLPAAAEHPADRSGDQRAVGRDVRRRLAQRADRQRRGADRPRRRQPVAARPERVRRLSARRPIRRPCRSRRSAALHDSRPGRQRRRRSGCSTIWRPSSGSCSRTTASARCPTPCARARRRCRSRIGR